MANPNVDPLDKVSLSAEIVAAYVTHNSVTLSGLPALIESVHAALTNLGAVNAAPEPELRVPAVSIRSSIKPEYLVCLDDGKKFKSLKRHLASHGMTPDQYRQKWGFLPAIRWSHPHTLPKGRSSRRNSALGSYFATPMPLRPSAMAVELLRASSGRGGLKDFRSFFDRKRYEPAEKVKLRDQSPKSDFQ